MGVSVNGNNITITNATIEIVNGANDESGVSYIIITPEGGVGALPFMAQGLPGQSALFTSIQLVQLADGVALPTPNPAVTLIDPGGPGLPSKYAMTFYLNAGPQGLTGTPSISLAADLSATPALGVGTDKFVLVYRNSDSKWVPTAQKVGDSYVSATIAATGSSNTSPRLLHSISIPAQPFDWRALPFAQVPVNGSVDTRVDLHARINDPATGVQCGYSKGRVGVSPPVNVMIPAYIANSNVPGTDGKITAGNAAVIHLRAEQKASTSAPWSTDGSPDATYMVVVQPVL